MCREGLRTRNSFHRVYHGSKCVPTLQESLNVILLLLLLRLCKCLFKCHVKLGACIEVNYLHVEYKGVPLIPESVGAYVIPQLCMYSYLSCTPSCISRSFSGTPISPAPSGLSYSICTVARCPSIPSYSISVPFLLYNITID